MGSKIEARLPRGMRDILPDKMIRRLYVIRVIREVFEEFGFEPLQTPALELQETLQGKYGPDAEKLIYHAGHPRGKEKLSMRYDLSVPLCRVVAMNQNLLKPFKRYQIAPVWRADRPQRGRYREFYQCDADTVGSDSVLADAETLNVIYEVLRRLGFPRFITNLNNRKILTGIGQFCGVPDDLLGGIYRSIDKLDRIGLPGVQEELEAHQIPAQVVRRLLELLQISGDNQSILEELRRELKEFPAALAGIGELREILSYLQAVGIPAQHYAVKFAMVRGLEYYTGPIYETTIEEPPMPSITGGGRYDRLIGMFQPEALPATGTTIGIERIIDVMEELGMFPPEVGSTVSQVLVTLFDENSIAESLQLASQLRKAGINTELSHQASGLGNQIRYADRKGIRFVAILGPDEMAAGTVTIKSLAAQAQKTVARATAAEVVNTWE